MHSSLHDCDRREILQETAPHLVDSICAYRAGYVAQPVAASWEIWRRERPSLAIYVAFEGPLDQYFMKFPRNSSGGQLSVLEQHLVCAALEHPLSCFMMRNIFGSGLNSAITSLTNRGYLSFDPSRGSSSRIWNYIGHAGKIIFIHGLSLIFWFFNLIKCVKIPSHAVSIRAIETEKYKVIDKGRDELLEEIEESKAFFQVYDGAVYMHQGKTYLVKELDISRKLALCQQADLKYYTKTRDYTDIHVIGGEIAYQARISRIQFARTTAQVHDCRVTTTWFGFRRIWKGSNKVFDTVELSLPTYSYQSQAVWVRVPQSVKTAVEIHRFSFRAGLHAASHAVLNVVPLYVICNSSDLAPECSNPHDTRYIPERILLYDPHPGGTGFSAQASDMKFSLIFQTLENRVGCCFLVFQVRSHFTELLTAALELLMSCCCTGDTGCPNCIQNLACGEYNELLHKDAAIMIIKGVLEAEESYFGGHTDSSKP
ncbi:ATP-dependent helicase HRQ1 [Vitis vinifera]|uniref:ATP-dependent helicase HRQ1 n=1 Tax=Vitis vinifera TaxID=29760 RepID=A0A438CBN8_VITVI|nr:ATP-dependent helicase HRQ1 [Vitis vinifera]